MFESAVVARHESAIMAGKQAKVLSDNSVTELLDYAATTRYAARNSAIVLLSLKAGLRAGEIAKLTWPMIVGPDGGIADSIELHDSAAKKGRGRRIPLHKELQTALATLAPVAQRVGAVIRSERGYGPMLPSSIVMWFCRAYRDVGLDGCSSHSGRRTFITRAARLVHKAGGSLRDVQLLAGHASIQTTQRYIDGDSESQRRLVALI
jgi:integrase/recombinase XerD